MIIILSATDKQWIVRTVMKLIQGSVDEVTEEVLGTLEEPVKFIASIGNEIKDLTVQIKS